MIVRNEIWGLPVAVEMTLLAVASFAVVWSYLLWRKGDVKASLIGAVAGVVLPAAALGILASELLKPPAAGLLVLPLFNPSANLSSWMVWGATGITLLVLLSLLFLLPLLGHWAKPLGHIAVWGRSKAAMETLGILMSAFGIFVAIYTGLVMSYERGIALWHNGVLPLLALFMGVAAGSGLYALFGRRDVATALSIGSALMLLAYLAMLHGAMYGPAAANFSARGILGDSSALAGMALAGLVAVLPVSRNKYAVAAAGALAIIATFLLRAALLTWGAWDFP